MVPNPRLAGTAEGNSPSQEENRPEATTVEGNARIEPIVWEICEHLQGRHPAYYVF